MVNHQLAPRVASLQRWDLTLRASASRGRRTLKNDRSHVSLRALEFGSSRLCRLPPWPGLLNPAPLIDYLPCHTCVCPLLESSNSLTVDPDEFLHFQTLLLTWLGTTFYFGPVSLVFLTFSFSEILNCYFRVSLKGPSPVFQFFDQTVLIHKNLILMFHLWICRLVQQLKVTLACLVPRLLTCGFSLSCYINHRGKATTPEMKTLHAVFPQRNHRHGD